MREISRKYALDIARAVISRDSPPGATVEDLGTEYNHRLHTKFSRSNDSVSIIIHFEVTAPGRALPVIQVDGTSSPRSPARARNYARLYLDVTDLALTLEAEYQSKVISAKMDLKRTTMRTNNTGDT